MHESRTYYRKLEFFRMIAVITHYLCIYLQKKRGGFSQVQFAHGYHRLMLTALFRAHILLEAAAFPRVENVKIGLKVCRYHD
jgi:hypothetical protein